MVIIGRIFRGSRLASGAGSKVPLCGNPGVGGRGSCRVAGPWFPKPTEIQPTGTRQEPRPPRAALCQTAGNGNTPAQTVSGRHSFNWTGPVKPDYGRLGQSHRGFSGILVEFPPPCRKLRTKSSAVTSVWREGIRCYKIKATGRLATEAPRRESKWDVGHGVPTSWTSTTTDGKIWSCRTDISRRKIQAICEVSGGGRSCRENKRRVKTQSRVPGLSSLG